MITFDLFKVSATFAASLITSPALGSYLSRYYSENFVIALATAISVFDLFFILIAVPESLPEKLRERSKSITWENVDPFKVEWNFSRYSIIKSHWFIEFLFLKVFENCVRRPYDHALVYHCVFFVFARGRSILVFLYLS